jgi:uncharacterized protein involved in exopolysaccharide biosynthesis
MPITSSVIRRLPTSAAAGWRAGVQMLWERKWILLTAAVIGISGTLLWLAKQTPIYRATARILIEADTVKILNIQEFAGSDFRDWDTLGIINTQIRILQSRPLAEQVVKALRLDQDPSFLPGAGSNADFAGIVQGGILAKSQRDAPRIVDVSFDHVNARVAALVANGIAQEFIRQNVAQKMSASTDALNWLREQINEIKPKLEKSETALQDYRLAGGKPEHRHRETQGPQQRPDQGAHRTARRRGRVEPDRGPPQGRPGTRQHHRHQRRQDGRLVPPATGRETTPPRRPPPAVQGEMARRDRRAGRVDRD